jgi:hypothetical protein
MSPNPQSDPPLEPPNPPFGGSGRSPSYTSLNSSQKDLSLSVNYLPSKFSRPHSPGVHKRRKGEKDPDDFIPKQGGGREAFRSNEARMPGAGDEDYDGITGGFKGKYGPKGRLRWNKFKWILIFTNTLVCFLLRLEFFPPKWKTNVVRCPVNDLFTPCSCLLLVNILQYLDTRRCRSGFKQNGAHWYLF